MVAKGGDVGAREIWEGTANRYRISFLGVMKIFYNKVILVVAQLCE